MRCIQNKGMFTDMLDAGLKAAWVATAGGLQQCGWGRLGAEVSGSGRRQRLAEEAIGGSSRLLTVPTLTR